MSASMYRSAVTRLTKERAGLEQDLARERDKFARIQGDLTRLSREIASSSSISTVQSKMRQAEPKQRDLARSQKRIADLSTKLATKLDELNRNMSSLERAEKADRQRQDTEATRRRSDELKHAREITREAEKQTRLHGELRRNPLVIDLARLPAKIKVLFLAANPMDLNQLRLDAEIRDITEKIRLSEHRDAVELISRWAVRPSDLLQALNEHRPHVIHFSGHGAGSGEIFLEDVSGKSKAVSADAIAATLSTMTDNVKVVVFNACFSASQAELVTQHVDVAVGMDTAVGDEAARVFAAQFYSAIGFARSVQEAFDQAIAVLKLEGIPEDHIPQLFARTGVEPDAIVLVRP